MCKKLLVFVLMFGLVRTVIGQVAGVDDPADMADSSGDIKRIEAWVDGGNLNLTMTVYGVFAPSVEETPEGMSNRYYYHWILDTDNNPDTATSTTSMRATQRISKPPLALMCWFNSAGATAPPTACMRTPLIR